MWLDLEGWMSKGNHKWGFSGAFVAGPHHIQGAAAVVLPDRTVLGHASVRRAWGDMWLLQATTRGQWVLYEPDASRLTTLWSMACRPKQGGVPFQVRLALDNRKGSLETRMQLKPGWRLAFGTRGKDVQVGLRHQREGGQVEITARRFEGVWGVARHVKMTHRMEGPRRVILGMVWMEGAGVGAVQRAVLPWADRMTWMQTPLEGARASIWVRWGDAKETRLGRYGAWHLLNKSPFIVHFDCRGKREGLSYLGLHEPENMANTSDIENGMVLNHNNGLWQIVGLHVKPGKGAARPRS